MRKKLVNALGIVALVCFIATIVDSLAHRHEVCSICGGRLRLECNVRLDRGKAESEVQKLACTGCDYVEFRTLYFKRTAPGERNTNGPTEQHSQVSIAD
jgi:hypothetical protein